MTQIKRLLILATPVIPHREFRQFKHVATKPPRGEVFDFVPHPMDAQNWLLWDAKVSLKGSYSTLITSKNTNHLDVNDIKTITFY